jgi:hypothetical protein
LVKEAAPPGWGQSPQDVELGEHAGAQGGHGLAPDEVVGPEAAALAADQAGLPQQLAAASVAVCSVSSITGLLFHREYSSCIEGCQYTCRAQGWGQGLGVGESCNLQFAML